MVKRRKTVQFASWTKAENRLAEAIVDRAVRMYAKHRVHVDRKDVLMDLSATHVTCPLDLERLATADDFNFGHDMGGIARHLNRTTGELENCFVPRFARPDRERKLRFEYETPDGGGVDLGKVRGLLENLGGR